MGLRANGQIVKWSNGQSESSHMANGEKHIEPLRDNWSKEKIDHLVNIEGTADRSSSEIEKKRERNSGKK